MNTDENLPKFLTPEGVANILNVSKATIYRYIDREENPLPVVYLSDQTIRIPYDQFQIWLEVQKKNIDYSEGGEFKQND